MKFEEIWTAVICSQPSYIDSKIEDITGRYVLVSKKPVLSWHSEWFHLCYDVGHSENTSKAYFNLPKQIYLSNKNLKMSRDDALNSFREVFTSNSVFLRGEHIEIETTDPYRTGIPKTWFGHPIVVTITTIVR